METFFLTIYVKFSDSTNQMCMVAMTATTYL